MRTPKHKLPSVVRATVVLTRILKNRVAPIKGADLQRLATTELSFYAYYMTLEFLQECGKVAREGVGRGSSYTWIGTE